MQRKQKNWKDFSLCLSSGKIGLIISKTSLSRLLNWEASYLYSECCEDKLGDTLCNGSLLCWAQVNVLHVVFLHALWWHLEKNSTLEISSLFLANVLVEPTLTNDCCRWIFLPEMLRNNNNLNSTHLLIPLFISLITYLKVLVTFQLLWKKPPWLRQLYKSKDFNLAHVVPKG